MGSSENLSKTIRSSIPLRMFIGTLSGVFLEYFDYTLYGFSAPYIASYFFPAEKPVVELLLMWGIFAIGFLLRPLGAFIFGHLADRFGRRHILIVTILLMSLSTIAIGCLPTYSQVGIIAPFALLTCRILQGLSVSTEYSGCSTYLLEFKKTYQGLISGIITSASGFGVFFASLLVLSFNSITTHNLIILSTWRWPFILAGIAVGGLGFYLRLGLLESPDFLLIKQRNQLARFPLLQLIRTIPRTLIRGIIVSAYAGIAIIVIEIYLPSYLQALGMQKNTTLQLSTYLALIEACFAILWGFISDYLGRIKTMLIAGFLMIIGIFPLLQLFHLDVKFYWFIAATLLAVIVAAIDAPIGAFLTASFPTATRYTGVSISYNLGVAIFGGLSPSILIGLQHQLPMSHVLPWYMIISAIIMLVALKWIKPSSDSLREHNSPMLTRDQ